MAYDLKSLQTTTNKHAPRLLIYGPKGIGKTSLAAEFPHPVLIDLEQGTPPDVNIPSFGEIESYDQVTSAIGVLIADDHNFKTLVIDGLDRLETLVWQKTCEENNFASIEAPGYGRGYKEADAHWEYLFKGIDKLRKLKNVYVIFVGHSEATRIDDPIAGPYSQYGLRIHNRAKDLFESLVDTILFVNQQILVQEKETGFNKQSRTASSSIDRWIFTTINPAYTAKNRYDMPERIKYDRGHGYSALQPYLEKNAVKEKTPKKEAA